MNYLFIFVATCFISGVTAQSAQVSVDEHGRAVNVPENYVMFVNTLKPDNIVGSPLFTDEWIHGDVIFPGNRIAKNIPLQIDLEKGLVYFQQNGNRYKFTVPVLRCSFPLNVNGKEELVTFSSEYPLYGGNEQVRLYQILLITPSAHLLKYSTKRIVENFVYNKHAEREYVLSSELIIFNPVTKTMHPVSNKKTLLAAIPEKKEQIETLCKQNNWRLKTEAEMIALLNELK